MECRSCKSKVIVEGIGDGKSKVTCSKCLESYIVDRQGRQMLTDEQPRNHPGPLNG